MLVPQKNPSSRHKLSKIYVCTVAARYRHNGVYSVLWNLFERKDFAWRRAGTMVFEDGQVNEGPFKYGVMQGANALPMAESGAKYEGGFWLNLEHGRGEELKNLGLIISIFSSRVFASSSSSS